jgi:hypothetical protein
MSDIKLGHRIYYFVDPSEQLEPEYSHTIHSTEAYSAAEAAIIIGERQRVTATRLIDVTDYNYVPFPGCFVGLGHLQPRNPQERRG